MKITHTHPMFFVLFFFHNYIFLFCNCRITTTKQTMNYGIVKEQNEKQQTIWFNVVLRIETTKSPDVFLIAIHMYACTQTTITQI